jgi:hypothetical protein
VIFQRSIQNGEHLLKLAHHLVILIRSSVDRSNVGERHKHIHIDSNIILWSSILRVGRWDENHCVASHWGQRVAYISSRPLCRSISRIITETRIINMSIMNEQVLLTLGDAHLERVTSAGVSLGSHFERLETGLGCHHHRFPKDSKLE